MKKDMHLIDRVYSISGCEYLSSLKEASMRGLLLRSIGEVDSREHSYQEWSEALSYFFVTEVQVDSNERIRAFLNEQTMLLEAAGHGAAVAAVPA